MVDPNTGDLIDELTFDETDQSWTINQLDDIVYSGGSGVDKAEYTIRVTYNAVDGNGNIIDSSTNEMPLTIKNPCLDPAYVTLTAVNPPDYSYVIATGSEDLTPTYPAFTVTTTPIADHTLCGDLTYTIVYDGSVTLTDSSGPPLTTDAATK